MNRHLELDMNKEIINCNICGEQSEHTRYQVLEMNWGMMEEFPYVKCGFCGSLKLETVPEDLSKYYPKDYYSLKISKSSSMKILIKKWRARATSGQKILFGNLIIKMFGSTPFVNWIKDLDLDLTDPILDVGCGTGFVLKDMADTGYKQLVGVDPFINRGSTQTENIKIIKGTIYQLEGNFRLIMFNHSLEHIENPFKTLQKAKSLLSLDGTILIRIPLVDSHAWHTYKTNWVQIDAPRHFFIPSKKGIDILASRSGLKILKMNFDSTDFQFWGSEQYKRGIPLQSQYSYFHNPRKSMFNKKEIRRFRKLTNKLNENGSGDQACFYLKNNS